jgi:hypothetical protein
MLDAEPLTLQAKELPKVIERANAPCSVSLNTHDLVETHDCGCATSTEARSTMGGPKTIRQFYRKIKYDDH